MLPSAIRCCCSEISLQASNLSPWGSAGVLWLLSGNPLSVQAVPPSLMWKANGSKSIARMCMAENLAYVPVAFVLSTSSTVSAFVVQFRCRYVPFAFSSPLFWWEYRVDMYLSVVRPLHQFRYDACRFAGAVDVIHHVTDTVHHHQTKVRRMVDCLFDNPYALLRRVYFRRARNSGFSLSLSSGSPAMRMMRSITFRQW